MESNAPSTDETPSTEHLTDSPSSSGSNALTPAESAYVFIGSLGLAGNLFVIVVILQSATMRRVVTTAFILNQSLVDGLAGFFLIMVQLFNDDSRHFSGLRDEVYCRVWLSRTLLWAMFMTSSLNLVAITLERLVAVWKPLWHKVSFTRPKQLIILVIIWIFGLSIRLIHGVVDSRIMQHGQCWSFGALGVLSKVTGYLQISFEFALPVVVFLVAYIKIAMTLTSQQRALHGSSSSQSTKVHGGRNIIKTMLVVCCCFLACWSSNEVYYLLYLLGYKVDFSHPFYDFSVLAVFCNCCCNPFIYIIKYKDFQHSVRTLLWCPGGAVAPDSSAGSSVSASAPRASERS